MQGTNEQLTIAGDSTQDIEALLEIINTLYPFLTQRQMKTRYTRLQAKIRDQNAKGNSNSPSQKKTEHINCSHNTMELLWLLRP